MHARILQTLLLMILVLPGRSWASSSTDRPQPAYRITAGISIYSTDFDVYNKGSTTPNGTLSEDFSYAPNIIIGSPYHFYSNTQWASSIEYSFSTFKLSQQIVDNQRVDLGTSVKGYYAFITPTLIYSFSGSPVSGTENDSLLGGLGIGIGYLNASGDIIFTETNQQQVEFDISGASLAISLFLDYRIGSYITRISGGLTSYSEGNLEYDAFGFAMDFAFVFEI